MNLLDAFHLLDIRVGTIVKAHFFEKAKKPAIQLWIDFGEIGIKKSSAQITDHYQPEDLIHKQVIAVVNFPPKQIGNFLSECLVLGAVDREGKNVKLLTVDILSENGSRIT
jgi:tRNA-binding protein